MAISEETYNKLFGDFNWGDIYTQSLARNEAENEYNKKVEEAKKEYESKKKESEGGFFGKVKSITNAGIDKVASPLSKQAAKLGVPGIDIGLPFVDTGWDNPISNSIDLVSSLTKGVTNVGIDMGEITARGILGGSVGMRKVLDETTGEIGSSIGESARLEINKLKGDQTTPKTFVTYKNRNVEGLEKLLLGKEQNNAERVFNFGVLAASPLFSYATNLLGKATLGTVGLAGAGVDSALLRLAPEMWMGSKLVTNQGIKQMEEGIASFGTKLVASNLGKIVAKTSPQFAKEWGSTLIKEFPLGYAEFKESLPFLIGLTETNIAPQIAKAKLGEDSNITKGLEAYSGATNAAIIRQNLFGAVEQYALMSGLEKGYLRTIPKFSKEIFKANLTGKGLTENILENTPDYLQTGLIEGWDKMFERLQNPDDIIENFIIYGNLPEGNVSKRQKLKDSFNLTDEQINRNIKSVEEAAKTPEGRKRLSVEGTEGKVADVAKVALGAITGVEKDGKTDPKATLERIYSNFSVEELEAEIKKLTKERERVKKNGKGFNRLGFTINTLRDIKTRKETSQSSTPPPSSPSPNETQNTAPNSSTQAPPVNSTPNNGQQSPLETSLRKKYQKSSVVEMEKDYSLKKQDLLNNIKAGIDSKKIVDELIIIRKIITEKENQQSSPNIPPSSSTQAPPVNNPTPNNESTFTKKNAETTLPDGSIIEDDYGKIENQFNDVDAVEITMDGKSFQGIWDNNEKGVYLEDDRVFSIKDILTSTNGIIKNLSLDERIKKENRERKKEERKGVKEDARFEALLGALPLFRSEIERKNSFLKRVGERVKFLLSSLKNKKGKEAEASVFRKFFTLMDFYTRPGAENSISSDILNDNVKYDEKTKSLGFKDVEYSKPIPVDEVSKALGDIFSDLFDTDGFIALLYTEPYLITKLRDVYDGMIDEHKALFKQELKNWVEMRLKKDPTKKVSPNNFYRTGTGKGLTKKKREDKGNYTKNEKEVFDKITDIMEDEVVKIELEIDDNEAKIEKGEKAFEEFKKNSDSFFKRFNEVFSISKEDLKKEEQEKEYKSFTEKIFSRAFSLSAEMKNKIEKIVESLGNTKNNQDKRSLEDRFFSKITGVKEYLDVRRALQISFKEEIENAQKLREGERVILSTKAPRVYVSQEKNRIQDKINSQEDLLAGDISFATSEMGDKEKSDFLKAINSLRNDPKTREDVNEVLLEANSKSDKSKSIDIEKSLKEKNIVFLSEGETSTFENLLATSKDVPGEVVGESHGGYVDQFFDMLSSSGQDLSEIIKKFSSSSPIYKMLFGLYGKAERIKKKVNNQTQKGGDLNAPQERMLAKLDKESEVVPAAQMEMNVKGGNNSVEALLDENKKLKNEIDLERQKDEAFFDSQPLAPEVKDIETLSSEISGGLLKKIKEEFKNNFNAFLNEAKEEFSKSQWEILSFFTDEGVGEGIEKDFKNLKEKLEDAATSLTEKEYLEALANLKVKIQNSKKLIEGAEEVDLEAKVEEAFNTYELALSTIKGLENPFKGITAKKLSAKNAEKVLKYLETSPSEADLANLFGQNFASVYADVKKKWENSKKKWELVKKKAETDRKEILDLKKELNKLKAEIITEYKENPEKAKEDGVEIVEGKFIVSPQVNGKIGRVIESSDMISFDIDPNKPLIERLTLTDAKIKAKTKELFNTTGEAKKTLFNMGKLFSEMGNLATKSEQTPEKVEQMKRRLERIEVSADSGKLSELKAKKSAVETLLRRRPEQFVKAIFSNAVQRSGKGYILHKEYRFLGEKSHDNLTKNEKGEYGNKDTESGIRELENFDWDSVSKEEGLKKFIEFTDKIMNALYEGNEAKRAEAISFMEEVIKPLNLATKKAVEEVYGISLENSKRDYYLQGKKVKESKTEDDDGVEKGKFAKPTANKFAKSKNIIGYTEVLPYSRGMKDYLDYWLNTYTDSYKREVFHDGMKKLLEAIAWAKGNRDEITIFEQTRIGILEKWAEKKQKILEDTKRVEGEGWFNYLKKKARDSIIYGRDITFAIAAFAYSIANTGVMLTQIGRDLEPNAFKRTLNNIRFYFKNLMYPSETLRRVREIGRKYNASFSNVFSKRSVGILRRRGRIEERGFSPILNTKDRVMNGLQTFMEISMGLGNTLGNEMIYIATAMSLDEVNRERKSKGQKPLSENETISFVNANLNQVGQTENLSVAQDRGITQEIANTAMFLGSLSMNQGLIFAGSGFRLIKAYREYWQKISGTKKKYEDGKVSTFTKSESRKTLLDESFEALISFFIASMLTAVTRFALAKAKGSPDRPIKEFMYEGMITAFGGVPYAVLSGLTGVGVKYTEKDGFGLNQNDSNILSAFSDLLKQSVYAATGTGRDSRSKNLTKIAETTLYMFGVPGSAVRSVEGLVAGLTDMEMPFDDKKEGKSGTAQYVAFGTKEPGSSGSGGGKKKVSVFTDLTYNDIMNRDYDLNFFENSYKEKFPISVPFKYKTEKPKKAKKIKFKSLKKFKVKFKKEKSVKVKVLKAPRVKKVRVKVLK